MIQQREQHFSFNYGGRSICCCPGESCVARMLMSLNCENILKYK